jgi:uncharacterized damage-inducible protein DinB
LAAEDQFPEERRPMAMRDALLAEFDHEMAVTRRALERVPTADNDWKPHVKSYSLGALAAHIANIPTWLGTILTTADLDVSAGTGPRVVHATSAALLAAFDRNVAEGRARLAATSEAELVQPWTLRNGDHVVFTMPKMGVLRGFVFSHSIHHRGQLSVYLRLRDVPVPAMYGPSADEQ